MAKIDVLMHIKPQHFKNIDALRFFAFAKVYLLHLPIVSNIWWFNQVKSGGGIGVLFFFVLSGFLITWLLTNQKLQYNKINAFNFLVRRSLRIWPVYFLVLAFVYFTPNQLLNAFGLVLGGYQPNVWYSVLFLENYHMLTTDLMPSVSPLPVFWSLCIEEHFYLVWLLVFSILPKNFIPYFLLLCLPLAVFFRWAEPQIWHNHFIYTNDLLTNLDLFATGGLLGYLVALKPDAINNNIEKLPKITQWIYLGLVILLVFFHKYLLPEIAFSNINLFRSLIFAIAFTGLIAVFISKYAAFNFADKGIISFLGGLSYGMYVYHLIAIHSMIKYCQIHQINLDNTLNISLFVVINLAATIAVSYLSKRYFENKFLQLKKYF